MITLKIKYKASEEFYSYLKELRRSQSCSIRTAFNLFQKGEKENYIRQKLRELNNIQLLDSWWQASALAQAKTMYSSKKNQKVIFGGKYNLKRYLKKLISKEEFKQNRLAKLISFGEANVLGNRKFRLDTLNNTLLFTDKRGKIQHKLEFQAQTRDRLEQLLHIEEKTKNEQLPLSVRVDEKFIYLMFEPKVKEQTYIPKKNRLLAIDSNPNSIGWSVCDIVNEQPQVIDSGILDLSELNKKIKNKKHFETFEICKFLTNKAIHHKCFAIVVEELSIKTANFNKGKVYNKTVNNNWIRTKLLLNLQKRCFINNIQFIEVNPAYTSIIGGTIHRDYPDPIAPTLEMCRRAYFRYQKNKFYPNIPGVDTLNELWKQTLKKSFGSWKEVSSWLKNSKYRYRVPLESFESKVFRFISLSSAVKSVYLSV